MNRKTHLLKGSVLALGLALPSAALAESIPSVVVTLENVQPSRGIFLTPPWIGAHDGTFDSYDGGQVASVPLGGDEIERLAEDGDNASITATFDFLTDGGPQASAVPGPGGPLAPGERASVTLNVDPSVDRYFSYASMIIPSNDAFIANGNPLAHLLFDGSGNFVGESFIVSGDETNDAGTEVNDEIASNVAFLAQAAPDTGDLEGGVVVTPAPDFAAPGTLTFPDGVLNHPVFANGDFNDADDRILKVSFRFVDLGADRVRHFARLSPDQEVQPDVVASNGSGFGTAVARDGDRVRIAARFQGLTGPLTAAHLHLGQPGTNGPIVVDMESGIGGNRVIFVARADDLTGPLEGQGILALLNELAAGNIYINLHTAQFPAGEIRGQLALR